MKKYAIIGMLIVLAAPLYISAMDMLMDNRALIIKGNFEKYLIENYQGNDGSYYHISIPEYSSTAEPGKALLPLYSKLISLPPVGNYYLEKIEYDYIEENIDKSLLYSGWEDNSPKDRSFYENDEWYPKDIVTIGYPVIMRGYRFCQISIAAVQYNPAKNMIRVLKDINAKFSMDASVTDNPLKDTKSRPSSSFSKIVSEHVYEAHKEGIIDNGSYLIITPDACVSTLQSLVRWKRKLGHEVTLTPLSEIGASPDNYDIKNYIQNAYLSWDVPPEFVILVGDVTGLYVLPSFYVQGTYTQYDVSDHEYSLLDGDDYFPDIFIGRISIQTLMELITIVTKIIHYESSITQGEWYNHALMISPLDAYWGIYTYYITKMNVKEKLINFGFEVDEFTYPYDSGVQKLISLINAGYSFINYRGYGYHSGWDTVGYNFLVSDDIASLNNHFMLPMITSITCDGGDFASSAVQQCFGEVWLKEGSPTNPKGAIGFIGPSERDTQIEWNNCMDMGIYQGVVYENMNRCGEMLLRGKMELYNNYPHNHAWGNSHNSDQFYFYVYNLLGEPGLRIWTDIPKDFTFISPDSIPIQQNYISVQVDNVDDKNGFIVALTKDDSLITKGISNNEGFVTLYTTLELGDYEITASKYGYLPITNEFEIFSELALEMGEVNYIDEPIAGTTVEYEFYLINSSSNISENILINISSDDKSISIITDSLFIDSILPQTSHLCQNLFFRINDRWHDGKYSDIDISVSSDFGTQSCKIDFEIISPELVFSDFIVQNNDCCLIQNQQDNIFIELTNTGSIQSDLFFAQLTCVNNKVTMIQDESYYTTISMNGTGANSMPFVMLPEEVLTGEIAQFDLEISQNDSIVQNIQFSIPIGIISEKSPTFSSYGYYAIESSDEGFFTPPTYSWIEINPDLGGEGVLLEGDYVTNDGYVEFIDLPFAFSFYGNYYYSISVCSEGWISMGEDFVYHRNKTIPSGCGPHAMIAPFWDNLRNGELYYFYDIENQFIIIEWFEFLNKYNPDKKETFQVILFDPAYYKTLTEDGEILFQYKTINNVDQGDNYATVGIENWKQTEGILLSYSNIYVPTAHELQDEISILFTTKEAPEIPLLEVNPQILSYTVPQDTIIYDNFVLSNISNQSIDFSASLSHFPRSRKNFDGYKNANLISKMNSLPRINNKANTKENIPHGKKSILNSDIEVLFPNGGETLTYGTMQTILWNSSGPIESVSIKLFLVNLCYVLTYSTNNDGEFSFYIDYPLSDFCTIQIEDNAGTAVDISDNYFSINIFDIIQPYENEILLYDTVDTLCWNYPGNYNEIIIEITRDDGLSWEIVADAFQNTGSYEYIVTGPPSEECAFKITASNYEISNRSDGTFSIVDSPINWLSLDITSGTLIGGESLHIPFEISTINCDVGNYEAYIIIESGIGQKIIIPVTLEVSYDIDDKPEEIIQTLSAHPNPFGSSTTIYYYVTTNSHELPQIQIYNVKGQLVREMECTDFNFGLNEVNWDGRDYIWKRVSSGLYFYQIKVGDSVIGTNKCLLIND